MKITFPNKTAKEIVDECGNKLGDGKLLFDISWYRNEDFYTKEKCRPMTVEIESDIEHLNRSYNEIKVMETDDMKMLNFPEMIYFIQEYYKKTGKYPDSGWSWTSSQSSDGLLVSVGDCAARGVCVHLGYPDCSLSYLGVRFFCSVFLKPKLGQSEATKYQVYATDKNGDGMVQDLGLYDEVEDITIKPAMFANDVIITIEERREE